MEDKKLTDQERGAKAFEEINAILDKYKVELVCRPQRIHGQQVWIPGIDVLEIPK